MRSRRLIVEACEKETLRACVLGSSVSGEGRCDNSREFYEAGRLRSIPSVTTVHTVLSIV